MQLLPVTPYKVYGKNFRQSSLKFPSGHLN